MVGEKDRYVPERGDAVWLNFDPQAGHHPKGTSSRALGAEQAGQRPALVLSPKAYNQKVGLALLCPVTSQIKGYPFEVSLPEQLDVHGVVLADQVRSLDWRRREAERIEAVPEAVVRDVIAKIQTLLR